MFYEPRKQNPKTDMGLRHDPWKALVQPRPIGWISTLGIDGVANLAPYSYYNAISESPPRVMFSSSGAHKDSARNILETREFVVNIVTDVLLERMVKTSAAVPYSVDEFELAGLTKRASRMVKAPAVAESPIHLECIFLQSLELPPTESLHDHTILMIGEVIGIYIAEDVIKDGIVDFPAVGRLGYQDYAIVNNKISVPIKK